MFERSNLIVSDTGDFSSLKLTEDIVKNLRDSKVESIVENLKRLGISKGFKFKELENLTLGKYKPNNEITLAERIDPQKGEDGRFNYLIEDRFKSVIKSEIDVDFYEVGIVRDLSKGDKIVEIVPPSKGTPGFDIFGNIIEGVLGDSVNPQKIMGKGTVLSSNEKFIVSSKNGVYKRNPIGVVSVIDKLEISGDQNSVIGNIDTDSSVVILGSIISGLNCVSRHSIKIDGFIENTLVESGDSIVCKGGVNKGVFEIKAGGTVRTKYIHNRKTVSCKDLYVEEDILNSKVEVLGSIFAKKISGGICKVNNRIEVDTLGDESFSITNFEIGLNQKILKRLSSCKLEQDQSFDKLKNLHKNIVVDSERLQKLKNRLFALSKIKIGNTDLSEIANSIKNLKLSINKMVVEQQNVQRKIDSLKKEYDLLSNKIESSESEIVVRGSVFPGVNIKIKFSDPFEVKEKMSKVKFIIDENNGVKAVKL
ncbi:MAG: hypothetical protein CR982_09115 [Candidatus Cloacimonadota bacterium]|nr:MAG: hypothetical protein CR982_09115 [Candidatus Cloacimonadota bacterium]PIE78626.1 MAG: hypothetical protein CSA15_07010 [Candidatus Delongbacteria bacterium]